jgi:formate dehydrogenase major subunit
VLLNGLMHVLIEEDLYDREFVDACCEEFDVLKQIVGSYPPEKAGEIVFELGAVCSTIYFFT